MPHAINIATSTLASTLRSWRGLKASKICTQPELDIILFDREGCSDCRFVREALTELNLNVMIAPCPDNGKNINKLEKESGSSRVPRLFDPNTETNLTGSNEIVEYLFSEYRGGEAPSQLKPSLINSTASKLASLVRFKAGVYAKPSRPAKQALTLFSFESSPFSRPVRELLCELELPYLLVNLGKQQWSDMGPANFRFTFKPYRPLKNTKRDDFFKKHGNVQVPFLKDPNTNVELFESEDILKYLKKSYGS
mgnify:CR=1 FL=1